MRARRERNHAPGAGHRGDQGVGEYVDHRGSYGCLGLDNTVDAHFGTKSAGNSHIIDQPGPFDNVLRPKNAHFVDPYGQRDVGTRGGINAAHHLRIVEAQRQ